MKHHTVVLVALELTMSSAFSAPKNIVVVGAGIQGTSVAYHLAKASPDSTKITLLEAKEPASAASGKGGGFSKFQEFTAGIPSDDEITCCANVCFSQWQEVGAMGHRRNDSTSWRLICTKIWQRNLVASPIANCRSFRCLLATRESRKPEETDDWAQSCHNGWTETLVEYPRWGSVTILHK